MKLTLPNNPNNILARLSYVILMVALGSPLFSQTLPANRGTDWSLAGLRDTSTVGLAEVDMTVFGVVGDGVTPNDMAMSNALASINSQGGILVFPIGNFLFNNSIALSSNTVIRGQGIANTTLSMDLGGTGNAINVKGLSTTQEDTPLTVSGVKGSNCIEVMDASNYSSGNWVLILQDDSALITSSWAANTVGQMALITNIVGNKIYLDSPLRLDLDMAQTPFMRKTNPVKNVGIECLKIDRLDGTSPEQSSNIQFRYAVNSWVTGIESDKCTFSHVDIRFSSNIYVARSYFHHSHDYGSGGRGYGVMVQFTANECLIEDNIFEHLRHSMILQAGSNGNVFAYNYSFDPFWSLSPSYAAGDMVLHGNYPFLNLFEQNICRNIVVDNSHGPNGPHNTIFRNRSEGFGIFFSETNSPDQNIIGNDIPNLNTPFSLLNYIIQGSGHFLYGNNNKGTIDPINTSVLPDLSYHYTSQPTFVPTGQWAGIGTPNTMGANDIPAYERYSSGSWYEGDCATSLLAVELLDFYGEEDHGNVHLFWQTAMEVDHEQFEIEGSFDGEEWKVLGSILSKGDTGVSNQYDFLVDDPEIGSNYFRLKMIGDDGRFEYSKVIVVHVLNNSKLTIFPNPTTDFIMLKGFKDGGVVELFDFQGRMVMNQLLIEERIDVSSLVEGVYFAVFNGEKGKAVLRFVKE